MPILDSSFKCPTSKIISVIIGYAFLGHYILGILFPEGH